MRPSPGWRRVLSLALIAAALIFLGLEVVRNLDQLRSFQWQVRPVLLLVSVLLLAGVFLWGIVVWQAVLRRFGVSVPFRPLARAWFLANFSRYIPGMIWQFVSLAQLGTSAGLAPATAITSLLAQVGFSLLSACIVAVYLIPMSIAGEAGDLVLALRLLAPLGLFLVHPRLIRAGLGVARRFARGSIVEWHGSWTDGLLLLGLSGLSWALYGGAFFLFLRSLVDLSVSTLPAVTAMNAIAFVGGYLAFFAPGGLGYKEGVLAILLAALMPRPVAFALSIASRLWTIGAESIPALFLLRNRGVQPSSEQS